MIQIILLYNSIIFGVLIFYITSIYKRFNTLCGTIIAGKCGAD